MNNAIDLFKKLEDEAKQSGYFLNPDKDFVLGLCEGLLTNLKRFGYQSCPCRLAEGIKEKDIDIICPCDYRDSDIEKYGACYCGLYVSKEVALKKKPLSPIPESRPPLEKRQQRQQISVKNTTSKIPVWRCRVCGYLCARENPPSICPICKAEKDRFETFML